MHLLLKTPHPHTELLNLAKEGLCGCLTATKHAVPVAKVNLAGNDQSSCIPSGSMNLHGWRCPRTEHRVLHESFYPGPPTITITFWILWRSRHVQNSNRDFEVGVQGFARECCAQNSGKQSQKGHAGIWYILGIIGPEKGAYILTFGFMYILYWYLEPLGIHNKINDHYRKIVYRWLQPSWSRKNMIFDRTKLCIFIT